MEIWSHNLLISSLFASNELSALAICISLWLTLCSQEWEPLTSVGPLSCRRQPNKAVLSLPRLCTSSRSSLIAVSYGMTYKCLPQRPAQELIVFLSWCSVCLTQGKTEQHSSIAFVRAENCNLCKKNSIQCLCFRKTIVSTLLVAAIQSLVSNVYRVAITRLSGSQVGQLGQGCASSNWFC